MPNATIDLEPYDYPRESLLSVINPSTDSVFETHLKRLCADGLSMHGRGYLIDNGQRCLHDFLLELVFEQHRVLKHAGKPSRYQSLFCWSSSAEAAKFAKEHGASNYDVYEVEPSGDVHAADITGLRLTLNPIEQNVICEGYWVGGPTIREKEYVPQYEYLVKLPVLIRRKAYSGRTETPHGASNGAGA
jgi:hypothetical protein